MAVYVPGSKGAPSFVRLYQYPVLGGPTAALANKSFFKADRVNMQWNKKGEAPPPLVPLPSVFLLQYRTLSLTPPLKAVGSCSDGGSGDGQRGG